MLLNIYWSKKTGDVIVPTVAKTEAGYWLDIEPVDSASLIDPSSLLPLLKNAVARGGRLVPTPSRHSFKKPVVLAYSRSKNVNDFERHYEQTSLMQSSDGSYVIQHYKKAPEGAGRVANVDRTTTFSRQESLDCVLTRIVEELSSESQSTDRLPPAR